ncbi:conserved hypothetical protein [uncultured Pleomorphomonas sp.]|uniref:Uncharacterized protein n=1 Tax=uncultured Pleomorphomonas sp. TaxID=442121 RepID=A0A212L225_9HYPH|nr:hypothetical protein [uncultured Pleomorphomonas sp.]SCM71578.1 conserved hypothetical protein [uncultured Pleomorphomonas sp.]
MWIFLNNAFVSIVDPKASYAGGKGPVSDELLVRARFKGDIERVFPESAADVTETPGRDYRFRALIDRAQVMNTISDAISGIDYFNFKGSVPPAEKWRHDAYMGCWSVMEREQRRQASKGGRMMDQLLPDFDPDAHADRFFSGTAKRARR